jgi:hypothetical protein
MDQQQKRMQKEVQKMRDQSMDDLADKDRIIDKLKAEA